VLHPRHVSRLHADLSALPRAFAPELPSVLFRTGAVADRYLAAAGCDVMANLSPFGLGVAAWCRHVLSVHRGVAAGARRRCPCRSDRPPASAVDNAVGDAGAGTHLGRAHRDRKGRGLACCGAGPGARLRVGVRHSFTSRHDCTAGRRSIAFAECDRAQFAVDQLRSRRRPRDCRHPDRGGGRSDLLRP